ncbi:hypothetical protein [Hufsiella ginkgonis]|uniref:Uncharacterized protein n=1 Tax=Hufsiella ginkgonis TaxID=2695274 RepID=A0A7K1Y332_9SPHI|nr:hypothetical protein [Hufsiella ginkgonis]MXV17704.1 hypothetical protein [Hufsiella ginkgonis]
MKTTYFFTTALLILVATTGFADDKNKESKKARNEKATEKSVTKFTSFKAPEFNWGSPEDATIAIENIHAAKMAFALPKFVWGEDTEVTVEEKTAEIKLPAFVWGNPEEVEMPDPLK